MGCRRVDGVPSDRDDDESQPRAWVPVLGGFGIDGDALLRGEHAASSVQCSSSVFDGLVVASPIPIRPVSGRATHRAFGGRGSQRRTIRVSNAVDAW